MDRLHAILVHLQSKRRVTARELADRFGLSLRTVYRDVKALEESGIPIIGESGIGYSVMEGYRLPPVMFTQEEASALLLAGKLIHRFTDSTVRKHFDAAMYKVKAVLRSSDKDHVEELDSKVLVEANHDPADEGSSIHMSAMRQAIVNRKVIRMDYFAQYSEEATLRDVEPLGLLHYGHAWHCIAWCRLRKDYRDFRLDRIRKIWLLEEVFDDAAHPSLAEYLALLRRQRELQEAVVSFDKAKARFISYQKHYFGFVSQEEKEGRVYMRFLTMHMESLARWILMFTGAARVESPDALHALMQKLMMELREHYDYAEGNSS
jgi:predicted DNA-binding transcriptional regulator YafY